MRRIYFDFYLSFASYIEEGKIVYDKETRNYLLEYNNKMEYSIYIEYRIVSFN